jgi:CDP-diglyceride synthetase
VLSTLSNVALFQIGWFASVPGTARGHALAGPVVVVIALAIHLRLSGTKKEWLLIVASAGLGTVAESALALSGLVYYRADPAPAWLSPPWITALWANFAMTLRHSLAWLEGRWALACLVGAAAGPLAYLAGSRLGAIDPREPTSALITLAGLWAVALASVLLLSRRLAR